MKFLIDESVEYSIVIALRKIGYMVKNGYNGFLFEPGNIEDCAEKINKLWNNPQSGKITFK